MNTCFQTQQKSGLTKAILKSLSILLLATIGFWFISKAGIPPFAAAFILIFFRGILRFLFKMICFLVSAGILVYLLSVIL
ncbi:MAG: hypothetical protein LBN93_00235 [Candidatus Symbiothrix sp.]|nr:hypothetical protein [Candidatus Symbiothrix sp.]